jgi:DNA-binding NarL/FixJ family response regulator
MVILRFLRGNFASQKMVISGNCSGRGSRDNLEVNREGHFVTDRTISIILADGHSGFRRSLKQHIDQGNAGIKVTGEVKESGELYDLLKTVTPDLVIVDPFTPGFEGIKTMEEIKNLSPAARMLVLTFQEGEEYSKLTREAGADGYLFKEDANEILLAIECIRQQRKYFWSPAKTR